MLAFVGSPRRSPRAGSDLARGDLAGLRPKNEARHETPSEATHEADNEPPDIDSGSSPTTGTVDHTAHRRSRRWVRRGSAADPGPNAGTQPEPTRQSTPQADAWYRSPRGRARAQSPGPSRILAAGAELTTPPGRGPGPPE
jgi:hypothetical protein